MGYYVSTITWPWSIFALYGAIVRRGRFRAKNR